MLLETSQLTKKYQRSNIPFTAADRISLSLDAAEFVSITGRSGSGKSTLLNMMVGLLKPTSGKITIEGKDILTLDDEACSYLRNSKIGYVPQGQSMLANLTALDNVRLPFYLFKRNGDPTEKALMLLEKIGVRHLAGAFPAQLSGGEMRRVSIARALINDPAIVIADEPTGDLDVQTAQEVMRLFAQINQTGTAVLLVTHQLEIIDFARRIYVMDEGVLRER